ncbi:MAG: flagellar biosynthesis anti-sigma factor FlgM [Bacterioplanes sp.]|nr:flagellar biosynthesis anti-sigma factor FlgM [Bacterioplanes sp.]
MNITKLLTGLDTNAKARNEPSKAVASAETNQGKEASGVADQVNLSASSKSIQQIESQIRTMPEVDDATVDRIRSAIQNGEYKIDYEKLAGKMLNFEERFN